MHLKGDGSGAKNVGLSGIIFPPWPFCKKRTINAVVADYASPLSPMAVTLICQYNYIQAHWTHVRTSNGF